MTTTARSFSRALSHALFLTRAGGACATLCQAAALGDAIDYDELVVKEDPQVSAARPTRPTRPPRPTHAAPALHCTARAVVRSLTKAALQVLPLCKVYFRRV